MQAGSREPVPVRRFREKPDLKTARRYVKAGNFYWNAGMFFWKTSVLLDALREYLPKTATLLASLPDFSNRRFARETEGSVSPLREHLDRLRGAREIAARGRICHRRFRLERCRKLERGLRAAGAR